MKKPRKLTFLAGVWLWLTAFVLTVAAEVVPVVKTKTETFHNVTLISKTDTHAFLKHSRGVANVRQMDLDVETMIALGLASNVAEAEVALGIVQPEPEKQAGAGAALVESWQRRFADGENPFASDSRMLFIVLGVFGAVWLFFSYCLMLICRKAGTEPGVLVWVPVLQMIPMFRAAGMSPLWLVGMLIPVVNIVAQVLWAINISKARGKGIITALLLLLPVTNFFAFLYLAFSGGENPEEAQPVRPLRLDPLPSS